MRIVHHGLPKYLLVVVTTGMLVLSPAPCPDLYGHRFFGLRGERGTACERGTAAERGTAVDGNGGRYHTAADTEKKSCTSVFMTRKIHVYRIYTYR